MDKSSAVKESAIKANNEFLSNYCQVLKITDLKGNTKEMYFPKSLDLERPKRSRTNFTLKQLNELEKCFAKNQYLVGKERKSLSKQLNLSEAQIKIWYQNRRTKHKKEECKQREQLSANAESIAATNIMQLLGKQFPEPIDSNQSKHAINCNNNSNNSLLLSSSTADNQQITITSFESISAMNSNPFFTCDSLWNDTNYMNTLYLSSTLLHK